jgi:hypothetical protein
MIKKEKSQNKNNIIYDTLNSIDIFERTKETILYYWCFLMITKKEHNVH